MARTLESMWEEHRGLGLLLALSSTGCLGLPRFPSDTEGSEGDTGDESTSTTSTTTTTTTGPQPTTSTTTTTTTGPQPTTSTTTSPTVTVTTTPPPIYDVGGTFYACQVYASVMGECYGEDTGAEAYGFCVEYLTYLQEENPECAPPLEAFFVCLSQLECNELFDSDTVCFPLLDAFFQCQG